MHVYDDAIGHNLYSKEEEEEVTLRADTLNFNGHA